MEQILIQAINLEELLDKIGELIEKKLSARPPDKIDVEHLSRLEVSELLKISLPTLNEWTKLGWLKSYKIGNRVLYKSKEVEESLQKVTSKKFKKYSR